MRFTNHTNSLVHLIRFTLSNSLSFSLSHITPDPHWRLCCSFFSLFQRILLEVPSSPTNPLPPPPTSKVSLITPSLLLRIVHNPQQNIFLLTITTIGHKKHANFQNLNLLSPPNPLYNTQLFPFLLLRFRNRHDYP